jgi:dienelactone hydrolase
MGFKKIGSVGYCFGAKYVTRFMGPSSSQGKGGIDVGYVAHPSFVNEEELQAIQGPYSIAAAETDHIFSAELRRKSEEILAATGQPYQINLFSGVSHGFAVRCDLQDKWQRFAKEQAFLQAVTWFDHYLAGN